MAFVWCADSHRKCDAFVPVIPDGGRNRFKPLPCSNRGLRLGQQCCDQIHGSSDAGGDDGMSLSNGSVTCTHRRSVLHSMGAGLAVPFLTASLPNAASAKVPGWSPPVAFGGGGSAGNTALALDPSTIRWIQQGVPPMSGDLLSHPLSTTASIDWSVYRYGTSSLRISPSAAATASEMGDEQPQSRSFSSGDARRRVPPAVHPTPFPSWLVSDQGTCDDDDNNRTIPSASNYVAGSCGYSHWLATYKFDKATFPQGRDRLTLRLGGAGLGTCLSLPNVGYSPPPFVVRFTKMPHQGRTQLEPPVCAYEDHAYNMPRRYEAFWPQSKITSIRVANTPDDVRELLPEPPQIRAAASTFSLTPPCSVTGDGCAADDNPNLHRPSSRLLMEFSGPTRSSRNADRSQSIDQTLVYSQANGMDSTDVDRSRNGDAAAGGDASGTTNSEPYIMTRQYIQHNIEQALQTAYQEHWHLELNPSVVPSTKSEDGGMVASGRITVSAFLPPWEAQASQSPPMPPYDLTRPLAIYSYKIELRSISAQEASTF